MYRDVGPDLPSPSRDGAGETEVIKAKLRRNSEFFPSTLILL